MGITLYSLSPVLQDLSCTLYLLVEPRFQVRAIKAIIRLCSYYAFGTAPDSHTLRSKSGLNFSWVSCFLFLKAQASVITALKQCLLESSVSLSWRLILCLFTNRDFTIKAHHTMSLKPISVQPHALPSLVRTYKLALCTPMSIYYAFAF